MEVNLSVYDITYSCESFRDEDILPFLLDNAEPVHSGQEGTDEPPTLIKEDLLSSGTVRQSTPDTQVCSVQISLRKTKSFYLLD